MRGYQVQLAVSGGPEEGRTLDVVTPVLTIGRGPRNDLVLRDGLVSQYHGELVLRSKGYIYRDLKSRHGTLVRFSHVTVSLHNRAKTQEVSIIDGAELMLGESVISVRVSSRVNGGQQAKSEAVAATATDIEEMRDEHIVTRSSDSLEVVARRLTAEDERLVSVFRLSRRLNATSDLDKILALIADTTFEAFSAANFFAITLVEEQANGLVVDRTPLVARVRGENNPIAKQTGPLLSQSLLEQVASTRESVLFVRDEADTELSQSIINARITACLAAPLMGESRLIGVMQADTRGLGRIFGPEDLDLFTAVASYAAFAIERVRLKDNIVAMFDGFVRASVSAVDARDPSTAGHSGRVADYTMRLANAVNATTVGRFADTTFGSSELTELRYAALLHDFGKIGVPEAILTKAQRLYPGDRRALEERLEGIAALRAIELQRELLGRLREQQRAPSAQELSDLDDRMDAVSRELAETRSFLLERQRAECNPPEIISRIRAMADRTYTTLAGAERPYLTVEELEHLTVARGTLTADEWHEMKSHVTVSRDCLVQIPWNKALQNVPVIAGLHHEKLDGSGYPGGVTEEDIPIQVRMLTICDVFDALTAADRPYRKAKSVAQAIEILREECQRGQLDPDLVELFCATVAEPLRRAQILGSN